MLKNFKGKAGKIIICLALLICAGINSWGSVTLKTIVTNPSTAKTQSVPVKVYLPVGVQPENVINLNNFEVGYDFEKSLYYVFQQVELAPKESVALNVEIEDIWLIPSDDLVFLNEHVSGIMKFLKDTKYYDQSKILSDGIIAKLEDIRAAQEEILTDVQEHISRYEANISALKGIKRDMGLLEELLIELGGQIPNKKLAGETYLGEVYDEAEIINLEKTNLDLEALGKIKLNVTIANPVSDKAQAMTLKYYLPKEVKPKYVTDTNGLELVYDVEKQLYYVYQENIELAPSEVKQYVVEIRNIWFIPQEGIKVLKGRSQRALLATTGTNYYETAGYLADNINKNLDRIITVQNTENLTTENIIGNYRLNLQKLNDASVDLAKLESIVVQTGGAPMASLAQKEGQISAIEEKIKSAGKVIFRGKIPSLSGTWTLIYWIIGFLASVSFVFFVIQLIQHKQVATDTLTGTYTRKYLAIRLPQELNRSKAQKLKYAILMIDVDGFKDFNDRYGHLVGDTILRETVGILKKNLRTIDIVGRFGGDEFFIALPNRNKEETEIVARRLVCAVASHKIRRHVGAEELLITISIGASIFPDDAQDYETLVKKADDALYCAKSKGGNRACVYTT